MKSDYQSQLIIRAYNQCATFQSANSITIENVKETIANLLWDDLLLNGYNVWSLLISTGDEQYNEQSFKKAADLVVASNITMLNVAIQVNKNDRV